MRNFKIILILSFFILAAQVSFAQTTKVYKSKDKITGKVNVLTVTENVDKSISVKRSTEEATEDSKVVVCHGKSSFTTSPSWIIPFREGIAERSGGSVTIDCDCTRTSKESTADSCTETYNHNTGESYCKTGGTCLNCKMTVTTNSGTYNNTSGYLIIKAGTVTID